MRTKQITLNDIALKLNVSTVTVSKALRGHPDISPETTELVKKLAEEMGYSPNFMARNLSSRKSNMIGLVVPKIAHHFFSSLVEQIYDLALENNYEVILAVSQENSEKEMKYIHTLLSMRVDGIIVSISQQTTNFEIFETVRNREIPLVFVDRFPEMSNVNTVTVDDRGGAYKAVQHAASIGYKKIALFAGNTKINIGRDRLEGFKHGMADNKLKINPDWILKGEFGEKSGYESFMKLYKARKLPDLIIAVTYPIAMGIYAAAKEARLKIPKDIDIICFGNSQEQKFLSPPLSCINQPTDELANQSVKVLMENIDNREGFVPKHVVVDTNLILRGTCTKYNRA